MKRYIFIFLLNLLVFFDSFSQQKDFITRGWDPGELYIFSYWYMSSITGNEYDAVFYSDDHGETISMNYYSLKNLPNAVLLRNIYSDKSEGVLYSYNISLMYISYDFGNTWQELNPPCASGVMTSGNDQGRVYFDCDELHRSDDFGQTFYIVNEESRARIEVGTEPDELYGESYVGYNLYFDSLLISKSIDGGSNFNLTGVVTQPEAGCQPFDNYPLLRRGANEGELYLITWQQTSPGSWVFYFEIYFSNDYGAHFEHRYTSPVCDFIYTSHAFTGGFESGEFYYMIHIMYYDGWNSLLKIYSSVDSAKTFNEHIHILDSTFPVSLDERRYENMLGDVTAYPNPCSGETTLSFFQEKGDIKLSVFSPAGKAIN